ncbi:hypothetical protein T265_03810 [Opisthorchis viverrini]|uniref:Uncharacterized protein n=1 Tax=Opisthorchis viverrini TaxID=6198 RepID=A0A074ZR77_OPIVI|nr:hypothetical protein T265_03810 [Opisthorchis viverrini]KER29611.1 hypothetical protein T265_03810 [Opisthorchis viverrini]
MRAESSIKEARNADGYRQDELYGVDMRSLGDVKTPFVVQVQQYFPKSLISTARRCPGPANSKSISPPYQCI